MKGTPCQIWIIRVIGKLIVFLHLTGLVRCRSPSPPTGVTIELIPCGKLPIPTFPNQGKEHSVVSSQLGKGGLQDTLPNSGRARVGSNYYFVIPGCDSESHNWTNYKGRNNLKPSVFAGDSVLNSDYSGGRKTHRFPPPYGLGSLSLTIASNRSDDKTNPLRDTPHPNLPQSGEGAFCRFPLNLGRGFGFARYPPQLGEG